MSKIVVVDEGRCLGCKTCAIECAISHSSADSLREALEAGQNLQSRLFVEAVGEFGMPIMCRHCEDAPCMEICPTGAINRPDDSDPVLLDQDKCVGCKFCMIVCPFGVIDLMRDGKAAIKCDLCVERTAVGEQPACVASCPTKALQLRNLEDWLAERRRGAVEKIAAGDASALKISSEK